MDDIYPIPKKARNSLLGDVDNCVIDTLPTFTMEELYNPVMATIFVGTREQRQTFSIQRELITKHSAHIGSTLAGLSGEEDRCEVDLPDTKPDVFKCFMTFIFMHSLTSTPADSTELSFASLIDMWIFGDKYDCRKFRQHVQETVQIKIAKSILQFRDGDDVDATFPGPEEVERLYEHTIGSSPLRRLLVDMRSHVPPDQERNDAENSRNPLYPAESIAECLSHALRNSRALLCRADAENSEDRCSKSCSTHQSEDLEVGLWSQWCRFHDHGSEEERRLCEWRREVLQSKINEWDDLGKGQVAEDEHGNENS